MFKKIGNIYDHIEEIFLVICIIVMVVVIFVQVLARYAFNNSLSWTEELARFLFVWASWIGISYGEKRSEHITITMVKNKLKGKAELIFIIIGNLFTLSILFVLLVKGIEITEKINAMASTTSALHMPKWIMYSSVPTSCFLMSVRVIKGMLMSILGYKGGEAA